MAIEALGAVASTPSSSTAASSVSLQDFVRILVSQLNNQDPLKPMDNQEFVTQLAQFTSLEQSRQLNQNLEALLSVQSTTQSVGLIGRTVDVQAGSGLASGQVIQLDFSAGEPRLTVRTAAGEVLTGLRVSQIQTVR
ncbi:MAG TPA: flagellar hook capping FlgD N-terminal domain-containing protein [Burkholderiaceae bacterium]|nr:flagellar hook capping FlgD N-terminal domain-containing protein [Burkholderiaceae bacterium]